RIMALRRLPHPVEVRREPLVDLWVGKPGPDLGMDLGGAGLKEEHVSPVLKGIHVLVQGGPEDTNRLHLNPCLVDPRHRRPYAACRRPRSWRFAPPPAGTRPSRELPHATPPSPLRPPPRPPQPTRRGPLTRLWKTLPPADRSRTLLTLSRIVAQQLPRP